MSENISGQKLPYRNPDLPVEERIDDLLSRMTLEEKVGQMMQLDARSGDLDDLIVNRHVGSILHTSPDALPRAAETVNTKTRLGIPLIIGDDCIHGYSFWPGATIFPEQLGMAASWDPDKIESMGRATAEEVSATGVHWAFSPVLCIARDTRWGRVGETFGEDPTLIGELSSAIVKGYQGGANATEPLGRDAILACAKHFAGYSETQGGRDASEADLSHRKLESWFLPPFERVAKEGCGTFMLGYESIDGVPVTFNQWLLKEKLRGSWNYQGTLITDWDNVGRSVWEQHVKPDYAHAAADAVKSGNDLIMTTPQFYEGAIEAVDTGLLDESLIDAAVSRILALKFRLGLFEDPRLPDPERIKVIMGSAEHRQANLELTRESVVLLRNDGSLPLNIENNSSSANTIKHIAVIGPLADDAQTQLGDWAGNSGQVNWMPDGHPREAITTVLDGIKAIAKKDRHRSRLHARREHREHRARPRGRTLSRRTTPTQGSRPRTRRPDNDRRSRSHSPPIRRNRDRRRRRSATDRRRMLHRHTRTTRRTKRTTRCARRCVEGNREAIGRGVGQLQAAGASAVGGWSRSCRRQSASRWHAYPLP